jgi:hypothetical protein
LKLPPHAHKKGQLIFIDGGVAYIHLTEKTLVIPARHYVWIPAGITHFINMHLPIVLKKGFELLLPVFKEAYKTVQISIGNSPAGQSTILTFGVNNVKLKFNIHYANQISHLQLHHIQRAAAEALTFQIFFLRSGIIELIMATLLSSIPYCTCTIVKKL